MEILFTCLTTNYNVMKKHWKENSVLKKDGKIGTNKPIGRNIYLGGLLVRFDWKKKKIISTKEISCPSGFDLKNNLIYVSSMRENKIYILDNNFRIQGEINNPYFNDLHSLNLSNRGILVTSTGLDAILEVDDKGKILFDWWATDNGFIKDQYGTPRKIDKSISHNNINYLTLFQTTHINSAIYSTDAEETIFASLFHQGNIISIDVKSKNIDILLKGMRNQHSIYPLASGEFIVSNTRSNEIFIFNINGKIIRKIGVDFGWIQDSIELSNENILVADSNNHKLVEIDYNGNEISVFNYPDNWRIYQVKETINY
ncbi:hypothetical protein ISS08_02500 [Candidatus Pacearchaeota archaeon]|nr:hypothetical protein [Candidatus Pacearchaeota archaeon]